MTMCDETGIRDKEGKLWPTGITLSAVLGIRGRGFLADEVVLPSRPRINYELALKT